MPILKALASATRGLAELKGLATAIPNPRILIDTLTLQEARASSEIENIVTTQDELFRAGLERNGGGSPAAKEVARYREALHLGLRRLRESEGTLSNGTLIEMFRLLMQSNDGFRTHRGTVLQNRATGEVVHIPPQDADEIRITWAHSSASSTTTCPVRWIP